MINENEGLDGDVVNIEQNKTSAHFKIVIKMQNTRETFFFVFLLVFVVSKMKPNILRPVFSINDCGGCDNF